MRERNVDRRARRRALGHRGDPCLSAADRLAHHVAEHRRKHGVSMLLLAVDADDRRLAVADCRIRRQELHSDGADLTSDRFARRRKRAQVAFEAAGEGPPCAAAA